MCIAGIISNKYEEFCLLGYVMQGKSRQGASSSYSLLYASFLFGLLFSPQDEAAFSSQTVDYCWTTWHYMKGGHDCKLVLDEAIPIMLLALF
jgi:hypothetical protein